MRVGFFYFIWSFLLECFVAASRHCVARDHITSHPPACWPKMAFINEYTQRLQEITLEFVSRFSKGRSRVWLMSKPSWTGWLANRTPWFPLTTYRRQQRTKREGIAHGCIVHCIDTLEQYMCIWADKIWPKSQRLGRRTQWFHQNDFHMLSKILAFWWDGNEGVWKFRWDKYWRLGFVFVLSSIVNVVLWRRQLMEIWSH